MSRPARGKRTAGPAGPSAGAQTALQAYADALIPFTASAELIEIVNSRPLDEAMEALRAEVFKSMPARLLEQARALAPRSNPPRPSGETFLAHGMLVVDGVNLVDEVSKRDHTIDQLSKVVAQLQIENSRLGRGRKRGGRAPDMATEAFSAFVLVQLRRGVAEQQLLEDLSEAYGAYGVPNRAKRAEETLALAKQRLAE
jgi:hypothetical protein